MSDRKIAKARSGASSVEHCAFIGDPPMARYQHRQLEADPSQWLVVDTRDGSQICSCKAESMALAMFRFMRDSGPQPSAISIQAARPVPPACRRSAEH